MRTRLAAVAMTLAFAVTGTTVGRADTVRVGIAAEPYPPFASQDASGAWVGWEIDFVNALCVEAKLDCVITATAWDGIIPSLTTRKIDLIAASMSITEERRKTIDFSDRYYKTPTIVVGAKGIAMDASPEGLKGKIIGVQVSTIHEDYARKYFAPTVAEIKTYQTQDQAQQDLVAGRVDAVQGEAIALEEFLLSEPGRACCDAKGNVADDLEILGLGAGLGLRKEDVALKEKVNAAIKGLRANGKYDEISKKYFSFDIYGDD